VGVASALLPPQALMTKLSIVRAVIKTVVFVFIQIPFHLLSKGLSPQELAMIDSCCADFQPAGTDRN
jgi:hypothetical protein